MSLPKLITFHNKGNSNEGFISIASSEIIPFEMKRIFWTYSTPETVIRGRHAHFSTEMVLIAVSGKIEVSCELSPDYKHTFILDNPNIGLYIPFLCWHTMKYDQNAVQLAIASTDYDEGDYIRNYENFLRIRHYYDNKEV